MCWISSLGPNLWGRGRCIGRCKPCVAHVLLCSCAPWMHGAVVPKSLPLASTLHSTNNSPHLRTHTLATRKTVAPSPKPNNQKSAHTQEPSLPPQMQVRRVWGSQTMLSMVHAKLRNYNPPGGTRASKDPPLLRHPTEGSRNGQPPREPRSVPTHARSVLHLPHRRAATTAAVLDGTPAGSHPPCSRHRPAAPREHTRLAACLGAGSFKGRGAEGLPLPPPVLGPTVHAPEKALSLKTAARDWQLLPLLGCCVRCGCCTVAGRPQLALPQQRSATPRRAAPVHGVHPNQGHSIPPTL